MTKLQEVLLNFVTVTTYHIFLRDTCSGYKHRRGKVSIFFENCTLLFILKHTIIKAMGTQLNSLFMLSFLNVSIYHSCLFKEEERSKLLLPHFLKRLALSPKNNTV